MHKKFLIASSSVLKKMLLLLLGIMSLLYSNAQKNDVASNKQVDSFVNKKMKELDIPGMAVAVVRSGKVIKLATYGLANLEWNQPVGPHTNFQIASCTKLLTSTLVMKAVYNKKLDLNAPIAQYIDSVPEAWKGMQVKHLLNHSSGIRNYTGNLYASTGEVIESLKDSSLEYPYGTSQHYANYDYALLGYLLERIYQKPFEQIVKEEVTAPLSMKDGGYDMEQKVGGFMRTNLVPQRATTYYGKSEKKWRYKFLYARYTYTAGGYYASIQDLANWAAGLDKELLFPKEFLSHLVMGRDSIGRNLSAYSRVGWIIEKEGNVTYAGHSGGPGLGDILRFPDQGYTFIVLSNDGELLPAVARAIASFYINGLAPKLEITKFERQ